MIIRNTLLAAAASVALLAQGGLNSALANEAQTAIPSQLLTVENEPSPKLTVDAPIPAALARGVALIPYRVENLRILPVLGDAAAGVSPRVGHLHITVDNLPWHWAQFSNDGTIVVADLPAGEHQVTVELASTGHSVYTGKTVAFSIPAGAAH